MAKIVLTINANNKATQSVRLLNAEVQTLSKTLSTIKVNKNLTTQINALTKHYKAVADAHAKITANSNKQAIADEKLRQQQSKTALAIAKENTELERQNKIKAQTESITNRTARAKEKDAQSIKLTISQTQKLVKQYADLLNQINAIEKSYKKGTFDKLKNDVSNYFNDVKGLDDSLKNGTITQDEYNNKVVMATASLQGFKTEMATTRTESKNLHGTLKDIVSGFFNFQLGAMLVMKPLQLLRSALSSINETLVKTEDSVIALQRVLPQGSATDGEISSRLYKIAQDYGQTFDNVSQIAQNFARTGMSWADTIKATEAAVLALNVAELDATEASEGLISILTQFDMSTAQLTETVDKLNKAADNNPVTTEKLLKALQRTGAAAKNANINLDDTIGIITTLSKATNRSGENLGTAINSLIQFSSKSSSLDTFAKLGGSVETAVEKYRAGAGSILEIWEKLSEVIKNRQGDAESILGGDLFGDEEWAGLNAELKAELGESYADITNIYDTASTFRKNYFIALLNDMENVKKVSSEIANANGYSQDENQKYLDTYTAKLNSLQAKWQDIANDEQGLLGIKKDLLDMGNGVLDIIQAVGGLKTALIAVGVVVGTIVMQVKGAQIVAGLQLIGKTIKSLTVDAIPNLIATWRAYRGETTLLNGQVVKLTGSTATFGQVAKAALPIVTAIIIAISALDKAIRSYYEEQEEKQRKAIEQQNEAIKKSNESIDAQKKEVAQMNEVADSVENLRKILDDSSQSEEEKSKAQEKLLQIQNTLVDSNNAYKDSLDLTNGSLKEQLGLIEQLTTEQLKQKANDFLSDNEAEIEIAKNRLTSTSTTNTDMLFSSLGWSNAGKFQDIINNAISGAGVEDVASINEDNTYTWVDNYGKKVGEGFKKSFWDGVGELLGFSTVFDKASYVGEANAGFTFSGTTEQQIDAITQLRDYIATNKDTLGLSAEEVVAITSELDKQLELLNSEEYKQAQLLAERGKLADDYINGIITEEEFLEKFYGIQKDISKEIGDQTNDISKVTGAYDDLISKLEELRDLQKESTEWEEKKLAVLEAEQALENAKNEATVRRFNQATGQWEWQTDEKKIAEAEKNLDSTKENLSDAAYDEIIKMLENKTATNEGLNELLNGLKAFLGDKFIDDIKEVIKQVANVDLDKPIVNKDKIETTPEKETTDNKNDNTVLGSSGGGGGGGGSRSRSYDNGGVANGLGYMHKATVEPESVNNPELTKKILSPVSNAEFNRYVRDMGIMFERSHQYAQAPIIERVGGAVDNRVNNSGQVFIQGVNVGTEKRDGILDALSLAPLMSNN